MHLFLGAPFLALEAAEDVRIGYVGLVGRVVESLVEDALQAVDKRLGAAHELGESGDVVGDVERVVPRRALMESRRVGEVGTVARVVWREP